MNDGNDTRAYIGLGGNIGDRLAHLKVATIRIGTIPDVRILKCSPVYESEPWGYADQATYLNAVVVIATSCAPLDLFRQLKDIEREMGRSPSERNHPRIIDLDILLFGPAVISSDHLEIPHPRIDRKSVV